MNNRLEQNHTAARLSKVLPALLLPTLLLVFLLCGLSQGTQAEPTKETEENLVPNPGFETSSPDFWRNEGSNPPDWGYFWSGSEYHEGAHSAGIWSNVEYTGHWWCDHFTVEAGLPYTFSGWIKTDDLDDNSERAFLTLAFYTSTTSPNPITQSNSAPVNGSSEWTRVTGSAVAPDVAQYAQISCTLKGEGTAWFDDIDVRLVGEPTLAISKSDALDPVEPEQSLVYTVTYGNTGSITATQVIITETYDVNVTYNAAEPTPEPDSNNRVWEVGTLGPGESSLIVITVTVSSPLTDGLTL